MRLRCRMIAAPQTVIPPAPGPLFHRLRRGGRAWRTRPEPGSWPAGGACALRPHSGGRVMREERVKALRRVLGAGPTRRRVLEVLAGVIGLGLLPPRTMALVAPEDTGKRRSQHKRHGKRKHGSSAQAKPKAGNHCIAPDGTDLNEFYGVSAQLVN